MNGDTAAVVEFARRSHEAAEKAANSAFRAEQSASRQEREISELRREMRQGFEALNAVIMAPQRRELHSVTEEDFEVSDTGTHATVTIDTVEKILRRKAMNTDAKRWRKALEVVGKIVGAIGLIVIGWLIKHFLGKP